MTRMIFIAALTIASTACVATSRVDRFTAGAMAAPAPASVTEETRDLPDHLAAGRMHLDRREWREARREYDAAARLIRARGDLPAEPMRWIALTYFYAHDFPRAATALDSLAEEAAARGRPDVRAAALIDAAWVYGKIGRGSVARERIAQVENILGSPFVPDSTRQVVERRLGR